MEDASHCTASAAGEMSGGIKSPPYLLIAQISVDLALGGPRLRGMEYIGQIISPQLQRVTSIAGGRHSDPVLEIVLTSQSREITLRITNPQSLPDGVVASVTEIRDRFRDVTMINLFQTMVEFSNRDGFLSALRCTEITQEGL